MEETKIPPPVTEEMLLFLDDLRKSGDTNMFGATPYIQRQFPELTSQQAKEVLKFWMKTFSDRHPERDT